LQSFLKSFSVPATEIMHNISYLFSLTRRAGIKLISRFQQSLIVAPPPRILLALTTVTRVLSEWCFGAAEWRSLQV